MSFKLNVKKSRKSIYKLDESNETIDAQDEVYDALIMEPIIVKEFVSTWDEFNRMYKVNIKSSNYLGIINRRDMNYIETEDE